MTERHPPSTPMTILFVDYDASILNSLRRLFRPHGYHTLFAESGAVGLEILAAEEVNLVISYMRMPEMDGGQFLEKVRARWPGVIRILFAGYADLTLTINAINNGEIYRYIFKPWEDDFVLIVREALDRQRLQSENSCLLVLTHVARVGLDFSKSPLAHPA
jgi:DNA-binding NtrC family response regulator